MIHREDLRAVLLRSGFAPTALSTGGHLYQRGAVKVVVAGAGARILLYAGPVRLQGGHDSSEVASFDPDAPAAIIHGAAQAAAAVAEDPDVDVSTVRVAIPLGHVAQWLHDRRHGDTIGALVVSEARIAEALTNARSDQFPARGTRRLPRSRDWRRR